VTTIIDYLLSTKTPFRAPRRGTASWSVSKILAPLIKLEKGYRILVGG
jgi:hypothetical protein